ncbi:MAG: GNAT family N-acetyltransferase [Anaerolineae bacterium]
MVDFHVRAATEEDMPSVRDLLTRVSTCPSGLDWRRFVVADGPDGAIIGCGQLRPHADGTLELASLATDTPYRRQGVARAIIERLLAEGPRPLYTTCRKDLETFYNKSGFRRIDARQMPASYLSSLGLVRLRSLFGPKERRAEIRERVDMIRNGGIVMRL